MTDSLAKPEHRADGSVVFTGRIARTGAHSYPWGVERRDSSELLSIVEQLPGTKITAMHPQLLLKNGGQARIVGTVLTARVDTLEGETFAIGRLHLLPEGVSLVKAGIRELSLGYETKVTNGFQTATRVDHVAIVVAARCGTACVVRADSAVRLDCGNHCDCAPCRADRRPSLAIQAIDQLTAMKGH